MTHFNVRRVSQTTDIRKNCQNKHVIVDLISDGLNYYFDILEFPHEVKHGDATAVHEKKEIAAKLTTGQSAFSNFCKIYLKD